MPPMRGDRPAGLWSIGSCCRIWGRHEAERWSEPQRRGARYDGPMPTGLALAANFVTALQQASRSNPASWRPTASIGKAAGIADPAQLEQAARDAERAGLVERWADGSHVLLTAKGRGITV